MTALPKSDQHISVEDYFAGEEVSEINHEYIGGQVFAMTTPSFNHGIVQGNLFGALFNHLQAGPCNVFQGNLRIHVKVNEDDAFYIPDVVVVCDKTEKSPLWRENPTFCCEILSDSTQRIDLQEKVIRYRSIESLQEYLILSQSSPEGILHRRTESGWETIELNPNDPLILSSLDFSAPLKSFYEGLTP